MLGVMLGSLGTFPPCAAPGQSRGTPSEGPWAGTGMAGIRMAWELDTQELQYP